MSIHTAMILAAGLGSRMRHLTQHTPKALLTVLNKPLIVYHLEKLAAMGISDVVINVSYLGEQIQAYLGDGQRYGVRIRYSVEPTPLETAGGIVNVLSLLGDQPFICINADVWTDLSFAALVAHHQQLPGVVLADLVLVANPEHNTRGDFAVSNSVISLQPPLQTFAGVSILHPQLFKQFSVNCNRLGDVLKAAIQTQSIQTQTVSNPVVFGLLYQGQWSDVGTPERLSALNAL
jgi:N-acetyl-alpha-D-muramate 1-phosphate uridylyltransferase